METQKGGIIVNQHPDNRNSSNSAPSNYNRYNNTPTRTQPAEQRTNPNGGQQQRRALTEEERRRIDAARRAAAQRRAENPGAANLQRRSAGQRNVPQGNVQGHRQRAAMVNDPRQQADRPVTQQSQASRDRAHRDSKPNGGLILFLLLAAIIVGVSIWQITKNAKNTPAEPDQTTVTALADVPYVTEIGADTLANTGTAAQDPGAAEDTPTALEDPAAAEEYSISTDTPAEAENEELPPDTPAPDPNAVNLTLYDTQTVPNTMLDEGTLILVNQTHPFEKADTVEVKNAFDAKNGDFKVSSSSLSLAPVALDAFVKLASTFAEETGSHELLLNSGHRTIAEQQDIREYYLSTQGEDYVRAYVAYPGESEHHTGLACDLTFYTDDGRNVPIPDYPNGTWIASYASDFGFILRYPENKSDITGIANEPWHFRYVGLPHSHVCEAKNWCLEEYVENIQNYSAEGTLLYITQSGDVYDAEAADGLPTTNGWLIYFVPKESGSSTSFKVVRGYDYEVSGTNAGGFIVTIFLG